MANYQPLEPLAAWMRREARRFNNHAYVHRELGAVTLTLRTGGATVTEPDLRLAELIDTAIGKVGSA